MRNVQLMGNQIDPAAQKTFYRRHSPAIIQLQSLSSQSKGIGRIHIAHQQPVVYTMSRRYITQLGLRYTMFFAVVQV